MRSYLLVGPSYGQVQRDVKECRAQEAQATGATARKMIGHILSCIRFETVRNLVYTFPGALPRIKLQIESRAIRIFAKEPRM
mmetsp:Transcript_35022/g.55771  ORF Transcript_35022/g.55771 Transcript_35022/m.55771 type:complete len:82 (+) Transcript_35022:1344-1589(+)